MRFARRIIAPLALLAVFSGVASAQANLSQASNALRSSILGQAKEQEQKKQKTEEEIKKEAQEALKKQEEDLKKKKTDPITTKDPVKEGDKSKTGDDKNKTGDDKNKTGDDKSKGEDDRAKEDDKDKDKNQKPPKLVAPSDYKQNEVDSNSKFFGQDYFDPARSVINAFRKANQLVDEDGKTIKDGNRGPVNIIDLGTISASTPAAYQLGPGDVLIVRYWSATKETEEKELKLDVTGSVIGVGTSRKLVLRGLNLDQAENLLKKEAKEGIRDAELTVQLKELRTFGVKVLGESFAPGQYEVPAVTTVFGLLYATGGPNMIGSLRAIQLKRVNQPTRTFDMYKLLLEGDGNQDVILQPGDTIFIPPARTRVTISGEVARPMVYELLANEKLSKAIEYAGGAKASGITQNIYVDSKIPGKERVLVTGDITPGSTNDPALYDGDNVEIRSIRPVFMNAVEIKGPVDQPRVYPLRAGMKVSDLVDLARGLLPDASLDRADIFRKNDDGSLKLITINLGNALKKVPADNIALLRDDIVTIYTLNDIRPTDPRQVTITGAIRRPGPYYRADGMKLLDLILQAGGTQSDASREQIFIQRTNPDGTNGPLIKVNLDKAYQGIADQNPVLEDRDNIQIFSLTNAGPRREEVVEVVGAVQRPGIFPLSKDMKVSDLIALAGQAKLDAKLDKAFLQRTNPNGTIGELFVIDLNALMAGDDKQDIVLQPKDKLSIQSINDLSKLPQVVRIEGAVKNPGAYPRSKDLTIATLIDLASGTLMTSGTFAEVSHSRVVDGSKVERVPLDQADSYVLSDGDLVTIPHDSEIREEPYIVTISGQVKNPGAYALQSKRERLSDLIKRAGGLNESAWEAGAQLSRNPEFLRTEAQERLTPLVQSILKVIQDADYQRSLARADIERIRAIRAAEEAGGIIPMGLTGAVPTQTVSKDVTATLAAPLFSGELVTPARPMLPSQAQGGNITIQLESALRRPNSVEDPELRPGDVIFVPETPSTVYVDGPGITLPQAVLFKPGQTLRWYIEQSGGFTADGAPENILIIKPSGALYKPKSNVRIELGDVIYVPTKVMVANLNNAKTNFESVLKTITNGALIYGIFRSLSR